MAMKAPITGISLASTPYPTSASSSSRRLVLVIAPHFRTPSFGAGAISSRRSQFLTCELSTCEPLVLPMDEVFPAQTAVFKSSFSYSEFSPSRNHLRWFG